MFTEYKDAFNKLTTVKNKKKQTNFKKLSKEQQEKEQVPKRQQPWPSRQLRS